MRTFIIALAICAAIAAYPYQSRANNLRFDEGLAGIHKLAMEGNFLCMSDHEHFGESGAWTSLGEAKSYAIKSWSGFTRLEYGEAWANFELAAEKGMSCTPAYTSRGDGWACEVKARPCRDVMGSSYPRRLK